MSRNAGARQQTLPPGYATATSSGANENLTTSNNELASLHDQLEPAECPIQQQQQTAIHHGQATQTSNSNEQQQHLNQHNTRQHHRQPLILITESAHSGPARVSPDSLGNGSTRRTSGGEQTAVNSTTSAQGAATSTNPVASCAKTSRQNNQTPESGDQSIVVQHQVEYVTPTSDKPNQSLIYQDSTNETNQSDSNKKVEENDEEEGEFEVVDGIRYKLVAAVTKPAPKRQTTTSNQNNNRTKSNQLSSQQQQQQQPSKFLINSTGRHSFRHNYRPNEAIMEQEDGDEQESGMSSSWKDQARHNKFDNGNSSNTGSKQPAGSATIGSRLNSMRRKSTALMTNLINSTTGTLTASASAGNEGSSANSIKPPRRLSIYEMTKSPPPETSLEIYLNERRRSSNISAQQVAQTLEQKSTFEVNYNQRQQYFKDLNAKLINQDKKLLNVVANRGQIHRHSVDIAQLPLSLALAKARGGIHQAAAAAAAIRATSTGGEEQHDNSEPKKTSIDQSSVAGGQLLQVGGGASSRRRSSRSRLFSSLGRTRSISSYSHRSSGHKHAKEARKIVRKFRKLDITELTGSPAPDVKIGQRVAYKEYYGNEFGTIRWIGRVPQISPDWTVGVEFDNAIGEGDGSLNGRRYFIAKDCFAKFLPLDTIALVDQHVGRPEPGTMISVMSAASRPGQLISIQRVSTVHVQHCFLNAPHRRPGPEIPLLAVNTRLHCQCPNCGPCAHVIKPPRTQRLARPTKNATHMCQFSTYTCCGMQSQEETLCTYQGNKVTNGPVPPMHNYFGDSQQPHSGSMTAPLPPLGNSWIAGSGYLSTLQAQQMKSMADDYKMAPPSQYNYQATSVAKHHNNIASQQHPLVTTTTTLHSSAKQEIISHKTTATTTTQTSQQASSVMIDDQQTNNDNANALDAAAATISPPNQVDLLGLISGEQSELIVGSDDRCFLVASADGEPIDSTLEADLERLSQARYGHHSSSSIRHRHQARHNKSTGALGQFHSGKNLLKTLRSLLSCLSIHHQHQQRQHSAGNQRQYNDLNSSSTMSSDDAKSLPFWCSYPAYDHSTIGDQPPSYLQPDITNCCQAKAYEVDDNSRRVVDESCRSQDEPQVLSGSSDCGFSSGSLNSSPIKEMSARKQIVASGDTIDDNLQALDDEVVVRPGEDQVRTENERELANRIYLNIAAKLIKSTGSISAETVERLGQVLDEASDSGQFDGPDQVIADIIGNVLLQLPEHMRPDKRAGADEAAVKAM